MKHTVVLEIAGAKFRMSSDAEEAHLRRLAETVNARIEALGPKAQRTVAPAQLLAVVALGLADDLHASEERLRVLEASAREVVGSAIQRIDRRLREDSARDADRAEAD
ncbi:MAG: cell division protein ZapA [Polyangiales bacterium]|nr:cell division protein ZapA [Myxococcales bacterium]